MKTFILLLSAFLLTLPAQAQIKGISKTAGISAKATEQLTRQISREASYVTRNARAFSVGLSFSPTKHILNQRFQFQQEYDRALRLYKNLQEKTLSSDKLREQIQTTIVNNTLKASLLNQLDRGELRGMTQEMEQYFNLTPKLPFFSTSAAPSESFAREARGYLMLHKHKPSWQLREIIQFGGMRAVQEQVSRFTEGIPQHEALAAYNLSEDEAKQLSAMYEQAEKFNGQIKAFLTQNTHSPQEYEDVLEILRKMNDLYDELLAFAKNSTSVKSTVEIYKNLLTDMEKFVAEHHRAPTWQDPLERPLHNLFEPLVFGNQLNKFEEIIPILTRLYSLSETYPAKRLTEETTLKNIKKFRDTHGFFPRSVLIRDFFDTRPDEPMLVEAMSYWRRNSKAFASELNELMFPNEKNLFPPFF